MMKLRVEEIKEILPHREPFLMLDRVEDYVPGEYAKAVKSVSANEWFFLGHFAETKVMPGVLIVEALAQTGGIALLTLDAVRGKLAFLGRIRNARFFAPVVPGDLLELETKIDAVNGGFGTGAGIASVAGRKVAECELVFAIQDA
ncbi:MAG: 3-hydroxyacyl-ACP dehydratase FabZ [Eubacteriales bacterium]|nr:3-hydroxyacyl-ACP dehydratase FabZ [Eubacteriales bacterium]